MQDPIGSTDVLTRDDSSRFQPTPDQLEYLLALTWDCGQLYERRRIAEGAVELERCWVDAARPSAEARLRERVTEMERHAHALYQRLGKPEGYEYRGGPVDWTTGAPRQRCAA